jgi:hypothetical protein
VIVADRRAHLARGEIEDLASRVVPDIGAIAALDEEREEVAGVTDHVIVDRRLQLGAARLPAFRRGHGISLTPR